MEMLLSAVRLQSIWVPYQDKIRRMLVEKYSFDTDGSYFSFAQCTAEQADTGAALMFLGEFISNI